jgi:hypothetical protein
VIAHAQKTDFVFRRNGRAHLNQRGRQFIRLLAAEVCASAVVMLDTPCSEVGWRVLIPTPLASLPFTFPPVRHRVPSHFNWTLRSTFFILDSPGPYYVRFCIVMLAVRLFSFHLIVVKQLRYCYRIHTNLYSYDHKFLTRWLSYSTAVRCVTVQTQLLDNPPFLFNKITGR